jgi:predicted RNA-binding Zn-ribbon protein involved in translation (DUF1610 family)
VQYFNGLIGMWSSRYAEDRGVRCGYSSPRLIMASFLIPVSKTVPHQIPCPNCGEVGLVRWERVITGRFVSLYYDCGRCEHHWMVVESATRPEQADSVRLQRKRERRKLGRRK